MSENIFRDGAEDFESVVMTVPDKDFDIMFGNTDKIECIDCCQKCSWNIKNSKGELDCFHWNSIEGIGHDEKGEPIVVACSSFTENKDVYYALH